MARAFSEQIKTSIGLAKEEAQKKLTVKLGKIVGEGKANYRYDVVINGELIPEVPDPSRTEPKYTDGTAVNIIIPFGNESARYISDKADYTLPEQTVTTMSTKKKERKIIKIYLCCPDDGKIKIYSPDGIFETDITVDNIYLNSLCTDGIYIYTSGQNYNIYTGFFISKISKDGKIEIIKNQDGTWLHTMGHEGITYKLSDLYLLNRIYQVEGTETIDCMYIAKLNTSGNLEEDWKLIWNFLTSEGDGSKINSIYDLCGDSNYIYIVCTDESISPVKTYVKIYNYSGSYINEFEITGNNNRITSDDTKIYTYNSKSYKSSPVEIYTIDGNYITSIAENIATAIEIKNTDIYIAVPGKIKKYNSSGVFQNEFAITDTVTDVIII